MNPRLARAIITFPMVLLPLVVLVPLPRAAAAEGGVFFVDSTEDGVDANLGNGQCATAGNLCTLRAAVMETNALPTAGAASCDLVQIGRFGFGIDRMFGKVVNDNAVPVSLTGSHINWPDRGNGYLYWLEFGARYYEGDDPEPPTSVSLSPPIALAGDSSQFWIARFPYGVVGWPEDWWDIELEFNDVCTVSLSFSILTPTPTWLP